MMTEEELNFTRKGIVRIYEKMLAGEMTDEDFQRAAENSERILREGGADIKVRYMGTIEAKIAEHSGVDVLKDFMEFTVTLPNWREPRPRQTKLFEERG